MVGAPGTLLREQRVGLVRPSWPVPDFNNVKKAVQRRLPQRRIPTPVRVQADPPPALLQKLVQALEAVRPFHPPSPTLHGFHTVPAALSQPLTLRAVSAAVGLNHD